MTRRRLIAILATLAAWPFTRLRAHEIAEKGSPGFAFRGERCPRDAWDATYRRTWTFRNGSTLTFGD